MAQVGVGVKVGWLLQEGLVVGAWWSSNPTCFLQPSSLHEPPPNLQGAPWLDLHGAALIISFCQTIPTFTPPTCAMNTAVVASYNAVPLKLIVMPSGRKNDTVPSSHPRSSEVCMRGGADLLQSNQFFVYSFTMPRGRKNDTVPSSHPRSSEVCMRTWFGSVGWLGGRWLVGAPTSTLLCSEGQLDKDVLPSTNYHPSLSTTTMGKAQAHLHDQREGCRAAAGAEGHDERLRVGAGHPERRAPAGR